MYELEPLESRTMLSGWAIGDLNHDSVINQQDAIIIAEHLTSNKPITPAFIKKADVWPDGQITWFDFIVAYHYDRFTRII